MGALWFVLFLPLITLGESQPTSRINQTDMQAAMEDMRAKSYHGFVILLKILNSMPSSLHTTDLTFLMPNDIELSQFSITPDHLRDFILSHSIPTPLVINQLLRFPNGSLLPSSVPKRMISITNSRGSGTFLNNARITTPNVCISSSIRCHGISAALQFDNMIIDDQALRYKGPAKKTNMPKPTSSVKHKSIPTSKQAKE